MRTVCRALNFQTGHPYLRISFGTLAHVKLLITNYISGCISGWLDDNDNKDNDNDNNNNFSNNNNNDNNDGDNKIMIMIMMMMMMMWWSGLEMPLRFQCHTNMLNNSWFNYMVVKPYPCLALMIVAWNWSECCVVNNDIRCAAFLESPMVM